jgi:hypothetical protein
LKHAPVKTIISKQLAAEHVTEEAQGIEAQGVDNTIPASVGEQPPPQQQHHEHLRRLPVASSSAAGTSSRAQSLVAAQRLLQQVQARRTYQSRLAQSQVMYLLLRDAFHDCGVVANL